MNAEEIRQKAIECVGNITDMCRATPCKHCTMLEDCKQIQQTRCPYPKEIWSYEHGFADGVEEGKKQANLDNNIECSDCVRQLSVADEKSIRADERKKVIEEVAIHLTEAGYTYDSNMGIGDNIGSALLKEYAKGYAKGEQDGRADAMHR